MRRATEQRVTVLVLPGPRPRRTSGALRHTTEQASGRTRYTEEVGRWTEEGVRACGREGVRAGGRAAAAGECLVPLL